MGTLVVSGAMLRCTMGSSTSTLAVAPGGATAGGLPIATVSSNVATTNIRPFGQCASPTNPSAGRQLTRLGVTPVLPACVPVITSPWMPGSATVRTAGLPVVDHTCQCQCQWGGAISVVSPGQQSTSVG
ncbi:MAG TPA: DUF4280 domain-containing protein [Gemmatimonadales bacterium]|nr:DUF4280 domain-containing protein [Gemmatimonadales bacterium]